jgi:hypothetical protein
VAFPRIHPKLPRDEYDRFFLILKDDLEFPSTYDAWIKQDEQELAERRTRGEVRIVTIHPEEFADWCRRSGQNPSLTVLRAFAIAKAKMED